MGDQASQEEGQEDYSAHTISSLPRDSNKDPQSRYLFHKVTLLAWVLDDY